MKSYGNAGSTDQTENRSVADDVVAVHKSAREHIKRHKPGKIESEADTDAPLDDIPDEEPEISDEDNAEDDVTETPDDGKIYDSSGHEVSIKKPMWSESGKPPKKKKDDNTKKNTPSWKKMPSRMSTGEWLLALTFLCIPVVNIILLFVWSFFSDTVQEEKKHFARASVILMGILVFVMIVFGFAFGGLALNTIKSGTEQLTNGAAQGMRDAIRDEAQGAADEKNHLTDDDFTN